MILFLHGAGERGDDLSRAARWGLPRVLEQGRQIPFVVLTPQCPSRERWDPVRLSHLLADVPAYHSSIDTAALILAGFSMGGFGAWDFALQFPNCVRALIAVAGGGNPHRAREVASIPAWFFHGSVDEIVPASYSLEMCRALEEHGGVPKLTLYEGAGHAIAERPFCDDSLYAWLEEIAP